MGNENTPCVICGYSGKSNHSCNAARKRYDKRWNTAVKQNDTRAKKSYGTGKVKKVNKKKAMPFRTIW